LNPIGGVMVGRFQCCR